MKLLFLFGFTLHNIEEALWLPGWSKHAKKFHPPVEKNAFHFAVIVVTIFGYLVTVLDFYTASPGSLFNYIFLGFVGMMGINTFLPHVAATIILRKYSPGLITAVLLNLPLSSIILFEYISININIYYLVLSVVLISGIVLFSLKYLFRLGENLIK
jgi:hypothetical protein